VVLHRSIKRVGPASEAYLFVHPPGPQAGKNVFYLASTASMTVAARRLFSTLRKLDRMKFVRIHVELAKGSGLAEAINDRLRRAAAR
jgi:L-threonylcarbamoyladenylate synthase